jgi:hypothetical protein
MIDGLACSHPIILALGMAMSGALVGFMGCAILSAAAQSDRDDEILRHQLGNIFDIGEEKHHEL